MSGRLSPSGSQRRALVAEACFGAAALLLPRAARAGAQVEEPLADSVRSVLSAAIADRAPPRPVFATIEERLVHLRWLGAMSDRLRKQPMEFTTRIEFLDTLWYESTRAGLDPALVLGLVQVESGF
ncbi:MAG: lytic transglycosylase domain-containing protein, partial [Caldimonas sp.]